MKFLFTDKSGRDGSHSFKYSQGEDIYSRYSEFEEWDEGMGEDETILQWLENAEVGDEWDYAGSFKLTRTE